MQPGAQQIWLPAWDFLLTRERTNASNVAEMDISQGDLEIEQSLTIRGVTGQTTVAWRQNAPADKVFELRGDYNNDGQADFGTVSTADYAIWNDTLGSTTDLRADGNDNKVIDQDDLNVWSSHHGNTLDLEKVLLV